MKNDNLNSKIGEESIPQKPKSKTLRLLILTAFLIVIPLALLFLSKNSSTGLQNIVNKAQSPLLPIPIPTPMPFRELTIPYLRERTYESKLGELETFSENQNYTSYITSYNSDGLKVYGLLTIPQDDSKKYPAIVFIHGYIPPTQYQTTTQYADYVDFLARNGFVVFKIDLRGHGNSEGESGGAYYSSDYVIDVLNAYSALQNSDFVNPQKIGLWGHSMAGNVVFRSLAAKKDIPAVVIWAGAVYSYSDFQEYGINDNSYRPPQISSERARKRQELFDTHGSFDEKSEFWKQVVPTNFLQDIKGAVQLNHAVDDDVVSLEYSRNLNKILDAASIPHEFNEYQSGGHNINGSTFTPAMQQTVEFFRENLESGN